MKKRTGYELTPGYIYDKEGDEEELSPLWASWVTNFSQIDPRVEAIVIGQDTDQIRMSPKMVEELIDILTRFVREQHEGV